MKRAREEGKKPAFEEDLPSLKGCASVFLTLPERIVAVRGCGYTRSQRKCLFDVFHAFSIFSFSKGIVCFIPVN